MAKIESQSEEEKLKEILKQKQDKQLQDCAKELQELLKKYNCGLSAQMLLTEKGIQPMINIIPLQEKNG